MREHSTRSLIVNAHNVQVSLCYPSRSQGTQVGSATINGHNNYIFTEDGHVEGKVQALIVQGHNNRFENFRVGQLIVNGHNNQFAGVTCHQLIDQGNNTSFMSPPQNQ